MCDGTSWASALVMVLLMGPVALAADSPAAPASLPGSAAAPVQPTEAEVQKHLAKGEVFFKGQWASLVDLFETYRAARQEIASLQEKDKAGKERQVEITKQLAQNLSEWRKQKEAVEAEKRQVEAKGIAVERILATPPPSKPVEYDTVAPNRSDFKSSGAYQDAYRDWQRNRDWERRTYQDRLAKYQENLARYQENQKKAKAELDAAVAALNDCNRRLDDLLAGRKSRDQVFLTERQKISEQSQSTQQNVGVLVNRRQAIAAVLREVPESVRMARGIVEWKIEFYSPADLQAMYEKMKANIEAERKAEKAKAVRTGREFPKDWRHPLQDEADELKSLIDRAKAAVKAA